MADLRGEAEDASTDARSMEDKARKSMLDAAKLADELRAEQEHAQAMEQDRKDMELRVHDIQIQLDEAEQNALKWGRKMIGKLENRIKELEGELDGEQRRLGDAMKNYRKTERGIKEYQFRQDEDRKNSERMQDLVDKLQQQVLHKISCSCSVKYSNYLNTGLVLKWLGCLITILL